MTWGGWEGPANVHIAQELEHRTGKGQAGVQRSGAPPSLLSNKNMGPDRRVAPEQPSSLPGGPRCTSRGTRAAEARKCLRSFILNVLQVPMPNRHFESPAVSQPDMPSGYVDPGNRPTPQCRHRQWHGHSMTLLCRGSCLCRQVAGPCKRLSAGAARGYFCDSDDPDDG